MGHFSRAVGPCGGLSVGAAALGGKAGGLLQSVLAQGDEFLVIVGGIDYIGEAFYLVRPEHGNHWLASAEILKQPGGDHIIVGAVIPEEIQKHVAAV